jgi:hypothetical protein
VTRRVVSSCFGQAAARASHRQRSHVSCQGRAASPSCRRPQAGSDRFDDEGTGHWPELGTTVSELPGRTWVDSGRARRSRWTLFWAGQHRTGRVQQRSKRWWRSPCLFWRPVGCGNERRMCVVRSARPLMSERSQVPRGALRIRPDLGHRMRSAKGRPWNRRESLQHGSGGLRGRFRLHRRQRVIDVLLHAQLPRELGLHRRKDVPARVHGLPRHGGPRMVHVATRCATGSTTRRC